MGLLWFGWVLNKLMFFVLVCDSQREFVSESRSWITEILCCKAFGVNHSLEKKRLWHGSHRKWGRNTHFGKHLCKNGTQELNCARRLTQLGISFPHNIWKEISLLKKCQLQKSRVLPVWRLGKSDYSYCSLNGICLPEIGCPVLR